MEFTEKELKLFLVEANKTTYASGDESIAKHEPDGSTTLEYKQGDWSYHDNYFGGEPYGGRIVLSYDKKPVYMMLYYGRITDASVESGLIYKFLREALRLVPNDKPYRGPDEYVNGDFRYINKVAGDVDEFYGQEAILHNGAKIYHATYFGGYVDL